MQHRGSMIIEVLLAIAVAGIVIASISNLVVSVDRIDKTSGHKDQAIGYAREALEIVADIATAEFGRTTGCTVTLPGYAPFCWVSCPLNGCSATYHIDHTAGWHLIGGDEFIGTNPQYIRSITLIDNGSPADPNNKTITVDVSWDERGQPKHVVEKTILTGWKKP